MYNRLQNLRALEALAPGTPFTPTPQSSLQRHISGYTPSKCNSQYTKAYFGITHGGRLHLKLLNWNGKSYENVCKNIRVYLERPPPRKNFLIRPWVYQEGKAEKFSSVYRWSITDPTRYGSNTFFIVKS